jgi:glycosyltransferase involved in cell wall biosynthesis
MGNQVQISAVIITYNEERNIARCIDSLKGVVDDIVVVDSYSTDRTEEICLNKGVRFVKHAFQGHIEQKNYAITQAVFPVVLSLDADEALSDQLRNSILGVKGNWSHDGYTMNRRTNFCGKWIRFCGWYPDRKLRLWNSKLGQWTGINPHDEFKMVADARISHLQGDLMHYSYDNLDDHNHKSRKYAAIAAQAMFRQGKTASFTKRWISPFFRFVRDYLIKGGFIDGIAGWRICVMNAKVTYWKYHQLHKLLRD